MITKGVLFPPRAGMSLQVGQGDLPGAGARLPALCQRFSAAGDGGWTGSVLNLVRQTMASQALTRALATRRRHPASISRHEAAVRRELSANSLQPRRLNHCVADDRNGPRNKAEPPPVIARVGGGEYWPCLLHRSRARAGSPGPSARRLTLQKLIGVEQQVPCRFWLMWWPELAAGWPSGVNKPG